MKKRGFYLKKKNLQEQAELVSIIDVNGSVNISFGNFATKS